jgi:hypothetical protein
MRVQDMESTDRDRATVEAVGGPILNAAARVAAQLDALWE